MLRNIAAIHRTPCFLLLLCSLCLFSLPAFATEADFEKRMARGAAALEAGDPVRAQEEFRAALKEHPQDNEALLYLAIALNRAGDPAAETELKTALRREPGNPRVNLELGTFYYDRKMYEESGDYFENLLTLKPDPDMKAAAEAYLANIRSQGDGKRWGVSALAGMQYDSNVPLAADKIQLPVGIIRRGDWRSVLSLGLSGIGYRDEQQELTGNYSFYQSLHFNLTNFNISQHLFDVTYKHRLSSLLAAKISGDYEVIQLGGAPFANDFSITPGVLVTLEDKSVIGLDYRFRDSSFKNNDSFPTNTDRNGVIHSFILSYRKPITETLNLRLGYTFDREITKVAAWGSCSHLSSAGLSVSLPNALLLDLSMDAASKTFDDILAGATELRSDITIGGGVSLTWQAFERFGVSLGYNYTNNASNISDYVYSRSITSIMFQGRY